MVVDIPGRNGRHSPGMNVQTLIELAGGVVALADRLGVARTTVIGWRQDDALPAIRVAQVSAEFHIPPAVVLKLVAAPKFRRI